MIYYVDMDGVLSNMVKAMCIAHGFDYVETLKNWPVTEYRMEKVLRLTETKFWEPAITINFWSAIEPTPEFEAILEFLDDKDWYILSSPAHGNSCAGKYLWIKKHIPFIHRKRKYIFTHYKEQLAGPNRLLIDDSTDMCLRFCALGGDAILFPRLWNSLYRNSDDPMSVVKTAHQLQVRIK